MTFAEISAILRDSGVVGAGGAGFPSYAKLNEKADTIILNCAECEPLLKLHRQVLEQNAKEILDTLDLIGKILGVSRVIIGVKEAYHGAVAACESLLPHYSNMSIALLPEIYPAGDEIVLIYEATGRVVAPGSLPISQGIVVYNVETILNAWYAIQGKPVTHKYVTICGEVSDPVTVLAPIGCTVGDLLPLAGKITCADPAYVMGGLMMGGLGSPSTVITKTSNAVIVLPSDHPVVSQKQRKTSVDLHRAMAACCHCHYCTDLCPRNLLGHPIDPAAFMRVASHMKADVVKPYVDSYFCCGCALCEMYACGQGLSPRALLAATKAGLRAGGVAAPKDVQPKAVPKVREYRRVPVARLTARLGVTKYDRPAPIVEQDVAVKKVTIPLSQHIGVPATPIVKKGDTVEVGQPIAAAADGKLSVAIHASVNGKVTAVSEKSVTISC
ncbi:MAG: SLBB domain-containing protein [Clostridia bacterium]|nr:SLBB domain-containing protein [Clostridia bacterium]MBQ2939357.1 SLBB domain-containing protein [Clostridia bacterium]